MRSNDNPAWSTATASTTGSLTAKVINNLPDLWDETWAQASWNALGETWVGNAASWAWNNGQDLARIGFGVLDVGVGIGMGTTGIGGVPGVALMFVGIDQILQGSMYMRYGRVGKNLSVIENAVFQATGSETLAVLTPGVLSLGLGWYGSLARVAAREAAAGGAGAAGASAAGAGAAGAGGLTEFKVGSGLLQQGGWLDRWAQFWKYDRDASITWGAASPILGGLWSIGRVERLLINDARFSVAWFDALAHESVHILTGTLLWPIKGRINGGVGELMFGWMRFGEEFVAYNVGRLVVGRLHGVGLIAGYNAYQSLAMSTPMVLSVVFFLPMEIVAGGYLYQKFWHRI